SGGGGGAPKRGSGAAPPSDGPKVGSKSSAGSCAQASGVRGTSAVGARSPGGVTRAVGPVSDGSRVAASLPWAPPNLPRTRNHAATPTRGTATDRQQHAEPSSAIQVSIDSPSFRSG